MAIRVLTKFPLHRLTSTPKPSSKFPLQKSLFHSTSPNPKHPIPIPQQPNKRQLSPLSNLLQRYGFSQPQLNTFLDKNKFLLDFNLLELEKSLSILLNLKIPQEILISTLCSCPGVLDYEFMKKWRKGFAGLSVISAHPQVIQSVLEFSRRFGMNPDGFCKKVEVLKGLGFSDDTVYKVLEKLPGVVMMNEHDLRRNIEFFVEVGIRRNGIDRIYNVCPVVLGSSVGDKLMPLFDEFANLGFRMDVVRREIVREPRTLCMELGELSRCLELLRSLKCRVPVKEKIFSEGAFRAGFEVKLRIDCLSKHGLIRTEAFKILWKEPRVIIYEVGDIDKKIDFLVHTMGYDISCLVEVPEYLGVNMEKQIVPRYNVIEYLRSKGGLGCEVGLGDLINHSRLRFYNLYVKPYPECERLYARCSDIEVRSRHPAGLWKLFKPKKFPESEEDIETMKSFMESLV